MLERVKKLQEKLKVDKLEGLIVVRNSDVRYLTGEQFEAGSAVLVILPEQQYLITDGRFKIRLEHADTGFSIIIYDRVKGLYGEAAELLRKKGVRRAGIRYSDVTHGNFLTLTKAGVQLDDAKPYLDDMRMVKDEGELTLIRKACAISDETFESILGEIRPGITERDVANLLEFGFRKRGADGILFDTIVASGPVNGADCHATVSDRKIEKGDLLTMDFGATYHGYGSDITRTVVLGKPTDEQRKIYEVVKEAKKHAQETLRAGTRLKDVAAAGVGWIEKCGYTVPHGIGHSFGYDAHEPLFISIRDSRALGVNMVTTLEPGIYIPGVGGVRLEDDYLIGENGAEQLTHCNDALQEL